MKIRSETFRNKLKENLFSLFGTLDKIAFDEVVTYFRWRETYAGQWLFKQGAPGDSLYILINGRLQVVLERQDGNPEVVGDISRGETVGEMAIFTGEARSASVRAIRDSVLVELNKDDFSAMITRFPIIGFNVTKLIIERLKRRNLKQRYAPRYVGIAVFPVSESVDVKGFTQALFEALKRRSKKVLLLDADKVRQMLGVAQPFGRSDENQDEYLKLSTWLDEQEADHDFVLYATDVKEQEWTRKCLRHADEVLLLASSKDAPDLSKAEEIFLNGKDRKIIANQTLVLNHGSTTEDFLPLNTQAWLEARTVSGHRHMRENGVTEFDRLARFICGETNGLVLSGGGAKGIAHLGIFRALEEGGIPLDMVGGTSIGAVFGGLIARGLNSKELRAITRSMFLRNPTPLRDYNLLPIVSLLRGKTLDKMLDEVFAKIRIEDLWLTFFCVASDLSNLKSVVFRDGFMQKAIRSSISIPAIFPPVVHQNSLLIDGGVLNNFPVDVLVKFGAGKIIGSFLNQEKSKEFNFDQVPQAWELFKDRFVRTTRRYHLPSMMTCIIQASTLQSNSNSLDQRQNVNLLFCPDLSAFSLLAWNKFDRIEEAGYQHAVQILEKWKGF